MLRWLLWLVFLPVTLPVSVVRAIAARFWPCTVLQIEIEGALADVRGGRALGKGNNLLSLVRALEHAAGDPKLLQVNVHLEHATLGLGQAEELRAALLRVKESGKEVSVSAQTLGLAGYWVALGASKVVLCPTGSLDVAGVASEFTLLRGLLDQAGVRARMFAKGRYKSMREMFTEQQISSENREMLSSIVQELYGLLVDRVASARRLPDADVRSRIDEGPFRASEALRLGLIDELAYPDELEQRIEDDKRLRALDAEAYLRRKERRWNPHRAPLVAVLEVRGSIGAGKDGVGLGGGRTTGSTSFVEQVRRARENPRVDVDGVDWRGRGQVGSLGLDAEARCTARADPCRTPRGILLTQCRVGARRRGEADARCRCAVRRLRAKNGDSPSQAVRSL